MTAPTERSEPGAAWVRVAVGVCEDYPEESRSLEQARADLDAARACGAKVLRIAFGWDAMEPERGRYDWSFWDDFVRLATEEFGIRLIPYVCYTPRWAARDTGNDFWRSPPRDPDDFGRFMRALVRRYRHAIRSWELWNEPDNRAYWLGDTKQFAALVRAGSAAVKAEDPHARVVLGGIATELPFLEALFEEERIAPAVDVVNLHSYFETWHPDPIERLPEFVGRAAEIVREHGEREPLWMAETGYSSVGGRAAVSEVYRARFIGEHTEAAQAAALVRTIVLGLATGQLELIAWYRLNDLVPRQDVIGDDNNRHLGLRAADGRTKAATRALRQLAGWFAHEFTVLDPSLRIWGGATGAPVVRAFQLRDGRTLVFAWLAHPGGKSVGAPEVDVRRARVQVAFGAEKDFVRSSFMATDAAGRALPQAQVAWAAQPAGGELELEIAGSEVVCVEMKP